MNPRDVSPAGCVPATQPPVSGSAAAVPGPAAARPARAGMRRFSMAQFLIALVLLLVGVPISEQMKNGELIEAALMTLVLTMAVLAVGGRRRALVVAAVLLLPAVAGKWVNHFRPDLVPAEVPLVAALVFVVFVLANLLYFILRAPRVNFEVLCAGVAGYLLLGLLWTFAYLLVARMVPESFAFNVGPVSSRSMDGFNAIYFGYVTLSTVGYGGITPVSNGARTLAMMEAMTGTMYMAVLIARLVALYSTQGSRLPKPGDGTPAATDSFE